MKKHFTKLLTLILCLILGISVVACSNTGNNSSSNESSSSSSSNEESSSSQSASSSSQEASSSSQRASYSWEPATDQQIGGGDGVTETTLFFVGDSTVCNYGNEGTRYYPRNGYGMRVGEYLNDKVTIQNLALSGRSSKSYIKEANYTTLKNSIKAGDYLVIGFGHNDEKAENPDRYTDAVGQVIHEGSLKYYLYNYYIKVALDAGATPILCTPIVRRQASGNYDTDGGHILGPAGTYERGNYPEAIRELGQEFGVTVIDLTATTKALYMTKTVEETKIYHATNGVSSTALLGPDNGVDNTHVNAYGASVIAHMFVTELNKTENTLKNYIDAEKILVEPDISVLVPNEAPAQ